MNKKWMWFLVVAVALVWAIRKPLEQRWIAQRTGLKAANDTAAGTIYTTYNTQLYTAPLWGPVMRFFKAGPYGTRAESKTVEVVDYSVQG